MDVYVCVCVQIGFASFQLNYIRIQFIVIVRTPRMDFQSKCDYIFG